MILVDTCIWADHLRSNDPQLRGLLDRGDVLSHPFVTGELAMGFLKHRTRLIQTLKRIPEAEIAKNAEVLQFVQKQELFGVGISYIDAHLLASTQLTSGSLLWTRDKRLRTVAAKLSLAFQPGLLQ